MDKAGGIGLQGYTVYRNGVKLGSPTALEWRDETVSADRSATYTVYPFDPVDTTSSTIPICRVLRVIATCATSTSKIGQR